MIRARASRGETGALLLLAGWALLAPTACSREGRLLRAGDRLLRDGDLQGAMQRYESVLELDPENHRAHYSIGVVHYASDRYDEALEAYDRAIELESGDADYFYERGRTWSRLLRHDESILDYEKCIGLDRGQKRAYYALGIAHYNKREYDEAVQWLRRFVETNPPLLQRERARELIDFLEK